MQPRVRAEILSKIDNVTNLEKSLDEVETALRANSEKIKLTGQGDLTRAEVNKPLSSILVIKVVQIAALLCILLIVGYSKYSGRAFLIASIDTISP